MAVDTSSRRDLITVAWLLPEYRGGSKRRVLDLFGRWMPMDNLNIETLKDCRPPSPIVHGGAALECNFEFKEDCLPNDVFGALRTRHSIDLTGAPVLARPSAGTCARAMS